MSKKGCPDHGGRTLGSTDCPDCMADLDEELEAHPPEVLPELNALFNLKCASCSFHYGAPTEDRAETAAFAHCRANPNHFITCTRPEHFHGRRNPVIVYSTEVH